MEKSIINDVPFERTDREKKILSQTDEEYHFLTWDDLKSIIANNDLDLLTRLPSQLCAYMEWGAAMKQEYGSMTNHLLKTRLHWEPLPPASPSDPPVFNVRDPTPFRHRDDYLILRNNWPYGLAPGIKHLVIWLKPRLPVDEEIGAITEEGRKMVEDFLAREVIAKLGIKGQDRILWFKNWTVRQSIRGVEHVHLLLRDVDEANLAVILDEK
ncbi:hypothetical protein EJ06DRAFT_532421 [Trichodelitschia bisporula]|uniref:N-acetylglucosamine-induced protein 1 n=1 Tax=Trichodelitschia bisporula TaxID=703511 RepID=A0A6G1HPS3_9PEZI|nr:hypothetical protein EJ06DRAFT_532421 [Trichodelitschia bisporula]